MSLENKINLAFQKVGQAIKENTLLINGIEQSLLLDSNPQDEVILDKDGNPVDKELYDFFMTTGMANLQYLDYLNNFYRLEEDKNKYIISIETFAAGVVLPSIENYETIGKDLLICFPGISTGIYDFETETLLVNPTFSSSVIFKLINGKWTWRVFSYQAAYEGLPQLFQVGTNLIINYSAVKIDSMRCFVALNINNYIYVKILKINEDKSFTFGTTLILSKTSSKYIACELYDNDQRVVVMWVSSVAPASLIASTYEISDITLTALKVLQKIKIEPISALQICNQSLNCILVLRAITGSSNDTLGTFAESFNIDSEGTISSLGNLKKISSSYATGQIKAMKMITQMGVSNYGSWIVLFPQGNPSKPAVVYIELDVNNAFSNGNTINLPGTATSTNISMAPVSFSEFIICNSSQNKEGYLQSVSVNQMQLTVTKQILYNNDGPTFGLLEVLENSLYSLTYSLRNIDRKLVTVIFKYENGVFSFGQLYEIDTPGLGNNALILPMGKNRLLYFYPSPTTANSANCKLLTLDKTNPLI